MNVKLFPEAAPQLVARGYRPVPITPETKAPTRLPKWPSYTYTPSDDARFADCGTGILTGDVLGVDIDIPDAEVVKELLTCLLSTYGTAPLRIGNKPKVLALYRAPAPGQRKAQTAVYKHADGRKAKVEVLAEGQQLVAYAIHPDTKQPYTWHNGDPLNISAADLPVLTEKQVAEIMERCAARLAQWGTGAAPVQPAPSQLGAAFLPPRGVIAADNDALIIQRQPATRAELTRALADYAEFDVGDYESWREAGAIIHHETAGSADGLELFIEYSRCLSGFYAGVEAGEKGCRTKWRSFGRSGAKPVTFGTLIYKLTTLRATRGLCTPQNPQKKYCAKELSRTAETAARCARRAQG
jgi:Primase C terminal 2 (PriCT-2)/Bifunctional DNA primase/polymerase, N-terminal